MSIKFKKIVALLSVAASLFITSVSSVNATPHLTVNAASSTPSISAQAHVQDIGWQGIVTSGVGISSTVGTEGRSLRLEDLKLRLNNASGGIKISTHVSCIGWLGYSSAASGNWAESGTTGRSLAIEAVKIELYGSVADSYNIVYRIHSQNIGWGSWVQNGAEAGTTGRGLRAEAIGIKLVAKNNATITTYNVKTNGANLTVRSGPSTSYTSLGKLSNGTAVSVYSISNGWAKIKFGNGTGYVSSAYLTQTRQNVVTLSGWQWPVANNRRVTQRFGSYFDTMQQSTGRGYHCGIDIADINRGTPEILSAASGTVKYRGCSSGNGNHIVIEHSFNGQTIYSLYSHLSNFDKCPAVGEAVSEGQKIGTMGNTGNSSGTHLHFAIFTGTYSSDPVGYTTRPSSNKSTYNGRTFYDPEYVIANNRLP